MTRIDPNLLEQLCAWMDGELPADEARFLQRRLDQDPGLRAQWERWQLASACLRGQPVRLMPPALAADIAAALVGAPARPSRGPWLAGVAAAVLVAVLLPRMLANDPGQAALSVEPGLASTPPATAVFVTPQGSRSAPASPVEPLPSVRDFPLARDGDRKPWPRSPLVPDQRSMEAYLVRHNALMAEDGLAGFMPYVDVVAHDAGPAHAGVEGNQAQ